MKRSRQVSARGRFVWLAVVVVGLGLPGLALGLIRGRETFASPAASILKNPQLSTLYLGDGTLTISEEVSDLPPGTGLGAFSIGFSYPRNVVQVTVEEGPFLGSTGRTTSCFTTEPEGFVGFHCLSSGANPGPTGSGILAYIHVRPRSGLIRSPTVGNGVLAILDDQASAAGLADVLGNSIPVDRLGDAAVVIRALEGDLNLDCAVNVLDEQAISFRYYAHQGSLFYDPWYDLEPVLGDGDIDIKDLQFVFGRHGRTCEGPGPTPTPTPSATATTTATTTPAGTSTASPTATATHTPIATGTPTSAATAAATSTPTATGTPMTSTPTATGTPMTSTPTATGTPMTSTPTATGTPMTSTPTVTGTPMTSTPTPRPAVAVTGTPAPSATALIPTRAGTGTPSAAPVASATPPTSVGPVAITPVPQTPLPTATPVGGVLPAFTPRARVLPPAGGGPAEGWTTQTTIAAGILAGVGLTLLLLSLSRRHSG